MTTITIDTDSTEIEQLVQRMVERPPDQTPAFHGVLAHLIADKRFLSSLIELSTSSEYGPEGEQKIRIRLMPTPLLKFLAH